MMNVEGIMLSERSHLQKEGTVDCLCHPGQQFSPERRKQKEQFITVTTASEQRARHPSTLVKFRLWGRKEIPNEMDIYTHAAKTGEGHKRPGKCKLSCHCLSGLDGAAETRSTLPKNWKTGKINIYKALDVRH